MSGQRSAYLVDRILQHPGLQHVVELALSEHDSLVNGSQNESERPQYRKACADGAGAWALVLELLGEKP